MSDKEIKRGLSPIITSGVKVKSCSTPFIMLNPINIKNIFLLGFVILFCSSCVYENEEQLRNNFIENFTVFEELTKMKCQDSHIFSISNKNRYQQFAKENGRIIRNKGLSESRLAKYTDLFEKLGIEYGIEQTKDGPCNVYFNKYYRGYLHSSVKSKDIRSSFDECHKTMFSTDKKVGICYVELPKENWYLYYYEN